MLKTGQSISASRVEKLVAGIRAGLERSGPLRVMEVCGTHTVALLRTGVRSLLPEGVRLISGPGCPVCVTAQGYIDAACQAAQMPGVTICTYGDMVRVPGCGGSLAERRAAGARVVVVYSARDALRYAEAHPDTTVVFLAVGFETTAPATAAVVLDAAAREIPNFVVLTSHKLVIPAMRALLSSGDVPIDGFLCPGHVSVIIGAYAYTGVAREFGKSCVIAGFEPAQMLDGILHLVQQRATGRAEVENVYGVAVTEAGNRVAWRFVDDVFETADAEWRALGVIPGSGLTLRAEFARFDAAARLGLETRGSYEPAGCRCGDVLQGRIAPQECPLFGRSCTPTNPVGPCMVSSEGTCAAHYKYGGAVTGVAWEARGLTAPEPPSKGRH